MRGLLVVGGVAAGLALGISPAAADPGNGSLTVECLVAGVHVDAEEGLVSAGVHQVRWRGAAGTGEVDVPVAAGESRSVFLHQGEAGVAATVVTDDLAYPGAGKVGLRLVNLTRDALQLGDTAPVPANAAGPFVSVDPGATVPLALPGTAAFDTVRVDAGAGVAMSVVAVADRDGAVSVRTVVTALGADPALPTREIATGDEWATGGPLLVLALALLARRRRLALLAVLGLVLVACSPSAPAPGTTPPAPTSAPPTSRDNPVAEPTGLRWHGRDIPVQPVDLVDGAVRTVNDNQHAGWYSQSARPGTQGTALIIAHDVWHGRPAAFTDLETANPGEQVPVGLADGSTVTFTVDQVGQVVRSTLPQRFPELFRPTAAGVSRLVLVTCTTGEHPVRNVVVELSARTR